MPPFRSFFMAGFECSSHRRGDGVRLDLIAATGHDRWAAQDYRAAAALGLRTARDGLRWHRIGETRGAYDWSSWRPMLDAAAEAGVEVAWDLFHYGHPDRLELSSDEFIEEFAKYAAEAARVHRAATGEAGLFCPINEISYLTWAVRTGYFPGAGSDEPGWLKRRLVRAAIAGARAIRAVDPECRFIWAEPAIHVAAVTGGEEDRHRAEQARLGQFEAMDMLTGRREPELRGSPDLADAIGLNFYPDNQWYHGGSSIPLGHRDFRPLADMIVEAWDRYRRPLLITETGAEGSPRPAWLHYVCDEVRAARVRGAEVQGICLYPVIQYPGWDDERPIDVGLFGRRCEDGSRPVFEPLAEELRRQQARFHPSTKTVIGG